METFRRNTSALVVLYAISDISTVTVQLPGPSCSKAD